MDAVSAPGRAVVIGTGAAGTAAARTLALHGWEVTAIDRGRVGGTCLWYGCMPKKALYHSARLLRTAVRGEMAGLTGSPGIDWQTALAWKWHSQETYAGDQEATFTDRGIRLVSGDARFVAPDRIEVDGEALAFDHAVVATGSAPVMPELPGIGLADTSVDALGYPEIPATLLVVGGGFVGIELATVFASLGTKVTVLTAATRMLEMLDEEVAAVPLRRLERMGVALHTGCRLKALSGERGRIEARVTDADSGESTGVWERVLMAVGRAPALDGLALDSAGVGEDGTGRPVLDEAWCSTNPRVWFAGDAAGRVMQTPAANYLGRTVAGSIASGRPEPVDTALVPSCLFTTPQVAQVGLSELEAHALGIETEVSRVGFEYSGAAVIEDERDGMVKLVFRAEDDRLIGAHIAAPTASDLIYAMALAMRHDATRTSLRQVVGIHPAYCEMLHRASF